MYDVQRLMFNECRVRLDAHVTNLPGPAAALVKGVMIIVGIQSLLEVNDGLWEPGTTLTHSCQMADRLAVMFEGDQSGRRTVLLTAALIHAIGYTIPEKWPDMEQPVNKWRAAQHRLMTCLQLMRADQRTRDLGLEIAELFGEAADGKRSMKALTLMAADRALYV